MNSIDERLKKLEAFVAKCEPSMEQILKGIQEQEMLELLKGQRRIISECEPSIEQIRIDMARIIGIIEEGDKEPSAAEKIRILSKRIEGLDKTLREIAALVGYNPGPDAYEIFVRVKEALTLSSSAITYKCIIDKKNEQIDTLKKDNEILLKSTQTLSDDVGKCLNVLQTIRNLASNHGVKPTRLLTQTEINSLLGGDQDEENTEMVEEERLGAQWHYHMEENDEEKEGIDWTKIITPEEIDSLLEFTEE